MRDQCSKTSKYVRFPLQTAINYEVLRSPGTELTPSPAQVEAERHTRAALSGAITVGLDGMIAPVGILLPKKEWLLARQPTAINGFRVRLR